MIQLIDEREKTPRVKSPAFCKSTLERSTHTLRKCHNFLFLFRQFYHHLVTCVIADKKTHRLGRNIREILRHLRDELDHKCRGKVDAPAALIGLPPSSIVSRVLRIVMNQKNLWNKNIYTYCMIIL